MGYSLLSFVFSNSPEKFTSFTKVNIVSFLLYAVRGNEDDLFIMHMYAYVPTWI